jgi:hypothetical protein
VSEPNDNARRPSTQLQLKPQCCPPNPAPLLATEDLEAAACVQATPWDTLTLSLPADTVLAVPVDPARWQRRAGRIVVTYTREELALAVKLALEEKRHDLETRLEWALQILAAATGCDNAQAGRLLARWQALNAEYTATVTSLAAVSRSVNPANPVLNGRTATRRKNLS